MMHGRGVPLEAAVEKILAMHATPAQRRNQFQFGYITADKRREAGRWRKRTLKPEETHRKDRSPTEAVGVERCFQTPRYTGRVRVRGDKPASARRKRMSGAPDFGRGRWRAGHSLVSLCGRGSRHRQERVLWGARAEESVARTESSARLTHRR